MGVREERGVVVKGAREGDVDHLHVMVKGVPRLPIGNENTA